MIKVVDYIGDDFKQWGHLGRDELSNRPYHANVVFLSAPTGTGKTTFALQTFSKFIVDSKEDGRVLILVPRVILKEQMRQILLEIFAREADFENYMANIQVMTYQALESALLEKENIGEFSAIICDEAHYFIDDTLFNPQTYVSFRWILDFISTPNGLVVFQSATMEEFRNMLISKMKIEPMLPPTSPALPENIGNIRRLKAMVPSGFTYPSRYYFYELKPEPLPVNVKYLTSEKERLEILRKTSKSSKKSLCFVSNKSRGEELSETLEKEGIKVLFITAENKEKSGAEAVSGLVHDSKFPAGVLIATSVLDVGINIVDEQVSTLILDTCDRTTFLQMAGRIRLKAEQELTIYIFRRDIRFFKNWRENITPRLQFQIEISMVPEKYVPTHILQNIVQKESYVDKNAFFFQNGQVKLNKLTEFGLRNRYQNFNDIICGLEKDSEYFIKKELAWLGLEDSFNIDNYASKDIREQRRMEIIAMIRELCIPISDSGDTKEKIHEKLQHMKPEIRNLDKDFIRSNESLSVEKFRKICKYEQLPFTIVQKEVNHKQMYWLIETPTDNKGD